uniref:KN motif and ankyrin repeat domain-containing protein 4-like n=1 Tax=Gouania willdenowi TaxID=441366 RepID=A0A8C5HV32_GOUWI
MPEGGISLLKKAEKGVRGKPPYSVETPYGFQLDLDFLKYVDDIEKGNTIKKVPIQRRSKGPRASTLPRHLNISGCGYRSTPWGSTGALSLMSRQPDPPYHGYNSWTYDHKPLSPTRLTTLAELEARIKEFDEQPLGEHIRPHLLRASSLPLTVLLRQGSESTDDPSSLHSSRDHLLGRNTSCEDVFLSPDNPCPQDCSGLLRRLNEALERVGELEMEMRVIPQLKSQIRLLQEERERLQLGLNPHIHPYPMNGTTEASYSKGEIKRPRHEGHNIYPHNETNSTHEWRSSSDLDELLTVTSLQAKVAALEQRLHETNLELRRMRELLKEQQEESRRKDSRIEHLMNKPGVWMHAERVVVDQDGGETVVRSIEPEYNTVSSFICRTVDTLGQMQQDPAVNLTTNEKKETAPADASVEDLDTAVAIYHIKKIKTLLEQQWECLCAESKSPKYPNTKVSCLQQEMTELVDILASFYKQHGVKPQNEGSRMSGFTQMSNSLHCQGVNDGCETDPSGNHFGRDEVRQHKHGDLEQKESSCDSKETTPVQVDVGAAKRVMEETSQPGQTTLIERKPSNKILEEAEPSGKTIRSKSQVRGTLMEGISETTTTNSEPVSADFIAACCFLKDHMNHMDNPNNDTRKALMVLFQHWFCVAAEETSESNRVSLYLKEVKKAAPSLLAFLVNLADDNGNTVLHYSVSHCNYDIVSVLLDTGVSDVNFQNFAGYTAVMLASLTAPDGPRGMEVVRRLMELGNINICSTQTGQTALHLAVRHGRVVMVRLLLSFGADANIQDAQGTTALMFASERGHTHIARLLLERGQCDLMLANKRGQTALSIATQMSHTDTANLLQAHAKARAL